MGALYTLVPRFVLSILAAPTLAQQSPPDACAAAISCDCANIKDAGLLTGPWREDCRKCEGRIIAECRVRYAQTLDALRTRRERRI